MQPFDLVVRGGLVVDGAGSEPVEVDIAVADGRIAAMGPLLESGAEEIDARGRIVTPGFVDLHTHYDGQATWESRMAPSSGHGVTTVIAGNCGVGFAPCRPQDREALIALMEGVEDIPGIVMGEGLPWNWETFPEYLDALESRSLDVDFGVHVPHSPLRVWVMGERGLARKASTPADRAEMRALVADAVRAGALGVSSSRCPSHRARNGELAPSIDADVAELEALASGLRDAGAGVFQIISETPGGPREEFSVMERISHACGRKVSFTLSQRHDLPDWHRDVLDLLTSAEARGLDIRGQVMPRASGALYGLDLSFHPFSLKPSYRHLQDLPLVKKVQAMRDPELRRRLISEETAHPNPFFVRLVENIGELHVFGNPPNYEPGPELRLDNIAQAQGRAVEEVAYDMLLEDDGHMMLYRTGSNYANGTLDAALELIRHPRTVLGLGDGGAHYGVICDASYSTFVLTHWVRDAQPGRGVSLPWAVKALTSDTAEAIGLRDRGRLAVGYKADINVIDLDRLAIEAPRVAFDLPAGGKRLSQKATGYDATILSGRVTYRNGEPTAALPGRLVRGARAAPS